MNFTHWLLFGTNWQSGKNEIMRKLQRVKSLRTRNTQQIEFP